MTNEDDSKGDLEHNPLWQLHKRRMLETDSALGDWRFEDLREAARDILLNAIERNGKMPPTDSTIEPKNLSLDDLPPENSGNKEG